MERSQLRKRIFARHSESSFLELALEIFQYQFENNSFYRSFVEGCKVDPKKVKELNEIPFLPVELFKSNEIKTGEFQPEAIFTSSTTTGSISSKHFIRDLELYEESFMRSFIHFYGDPSDYVFLALLPSYLERSGSSLIYMMEKLISESTDLRSGFFLNEFDKLNELLIQLKSENKKVVLVGVTYALLDFAEKHSINFPELIVMETGGMKGKRKEMVRDEVHEILKPAFGVLSIHSEYGMTELLSQAYSKGHGIFETPPWMRILVREMNDPLNIAAHGRSGAINIIDLANLDSCAFIATQDLGKLVNDTAFEVIGRFDYSDIRGCNLMVE
ncbi:MAG: acyl transferase [Bacteroidia bacterium]|nr:acyl transferase [Bacteroidia bacterium]MBP9922404.1 acyl transferase [Bacteroidia bacterium]